MKIATVAIAVSAVLLTGCSTYMAPTLVDSSLECWSELPQVEVAKNTEGLPEYRTCMASKSQPTKAFKVESKLKRIGAKYCLNQGKYFQPLRMRAAEGNFGEDVPASERIGARVELIFTCSDTANGQSALDKKVDRINKKLTVQKVQEYDSLLQLLKLKEAGVLTEEEFQKEKAKLLK